MGCRKKHKHVGQAKGQAKGLPHFLIRAYRFVLTGGALK
jgi:hypothetical protein